MPNLKRRNRKTGEEEGARASGKKIAVFAAAGFLAAALAAGAALFFNRAPVVLVTDSLFTGLYGRRRAFVRQVELSLLLVRPVITVFVSSGAGPDLVSLAVWNTSKQPFTVFFPYRYHEAALRYAREHPGVQSVVFAGREKAPPALAASAPAAWFSTDVRTDFYRAGYCAGALTVPENRIEESFGAAPREIVVFQDEYSVGDKEREAFSLGLEAYRADIRGLPAGNPVPANASFPGIPLFTGRNWDFSGSDNPEDIAKLACAVVSGGGEVFFKADIGIPLVMFTWLNPAVLPDETVLTFDDSPWALIPQALDILKTGRREGVIPSVIHGGISALPLDLAGAAGRIFGLSSGSHNRILPKRTVDRIKKLNFLKNMADN
jgi:hypothetical protein